MTMQINRRHLLAETAAVLAAPAVLRRRALAATTLTLGHGAAPGNPRTLAAEAFARLVNEKTEGRVTVNIAGSEQLGNDVGHAHQPAHRGPRPHREQPGCRLGTGP